MADDIPQLKVAELTPVVMVISALEEALEEANSGKLRNVVIVGDLTGSLTFSICGMDDRVRLLGLLEMAKRSVKIVTDE